MLLAGTVKCQTLMAVSQSLKFGRTAQGEIQRKKLSGRQTGSPASCPIDGIPQFEVVIIGEN